MPLTKLLHKNSRRALLSVLPCAETSQHGPSFFSKARGPVALAIAHADLNDNFPQNNISNDLPVSI